MQTSKHYREYSVLDLCKIAEEVEQYWEAHKVFEKSISEREDKASYVFYEGPPSANGLPGIHHVMARTIKDLFCRYHSMKGKKVLRKGGWDTHGLPVELEVEKTLQITKEDVGEKISIEEYNEACKKAVMKYTHVWEELTKKMGYWVDLDDPYITYDNKYIESVWFLLKKLFSEDLLYKGYSIQPYSPAAGSGLSSHELNQPGTYKQVKDTTIVAQFKVLPDENSNFLFENHSLETFILAWTTTPWTLPSNSALAVGKKIKYGLIKTINPYTGQHVAVVLAVDLIGTLFSKENENGDFEAYERGQKELPYVILKTFQGEDLIGISYEQLLNYVTPDEPAFKVIAGDFVSTEDGTGIVHIAPTFGADDFRVAKSAGIPAITVSRDGVEVPLVDLQGRFVEEVKPFAGEYVKEEYLKDKDKSADYQSVDVRIAIHLKKANRAFRVEKYEHSYPHCWRTDKPVLYYPMDAWFIRTTAKKDLLIELNQTINWKPSSTGTGRFGNWLENLQDWNLSRSRFWGIPIPVWVTEDKTEQLCIGSYEELREACEKAVQAGVMKENPLKGFVPGDFSKENYQTFDVHRPLVDDIVLVSPSGKAMKREKDLIDVWFDSGSMPYAQWHYPFENKEIFENNFPADFIAEGVDQTRGWFFTLHAIATMTMGRVAYKNVVSNGLVLDKAGQKMSKRLGNTIDPFETLKKYGPDATRWYIISNAQPWDNLKFDLDGIEEVQKKFFRAFHHCYSFYALYANVDQFANNEGAVAIKDRPEIDRWIISKLHSTILAVTEYYEDYEPTKAARILQDFVTEHLSNWYVRLSRRRFWKGTFSEDKIAAYQTLLECLEVICKMAAPIAPFYMDQIYRDLNPSGNSVHLANFPIGNHENIDQELETRMEIAQKTSSLVLGLRKREKIKVRQPLRKLMVPVTTKAFESDIKAVMSLILSETNVKDAEYLPMDSGWFEKEIKPNFKTLGPRLGANMKSVANEIGKMSQKDIQDFEKNGVFELHSGGQKISISLEEVEIATKDIPGWVVANEGSLTVALDISIDEKLRNEGLARELVNRIQGLRREKGLEVTDRIVLEIQEHKGISAAIQNNLEYICTETQATSLELVDQLETSESITIVVEEGIETQISIARFHKN